VKRVLVTVALVAAPLLADDVYLRGGGRITGQILKMSNDSVTVDVGGGTLTVKMSSVVKIEGGKSPLQEYRERAKSVPPGDAEAWRELARWAVTQTLATAAEEAWKNVLATLPNDPEANQAIGRVQYGGSWVTEDQAYTAQGYIKFEGEWMRPQERQAILQERRASEAAYQQAEAARIQGEQKAEAAEKAKEDAESAAFMRGGFPQSSSDVLYWGGGTVWPSQPVQQSGGAQ
jgi:hypothetical protein